MRTGLLSFLLTGFFLFSLSASSSPLCSKTVAEFSANHTLGAAEQAYQLLKMIDPEGTGFTNYTLDPSPSEIAVFGPETAKKQKLNATLSNRLAHIYNRIATTPFGKPNRLIQSFEVDLRSSPLAGFTRKGLAVQFKTLRMNAPAILATGVGAILLAGDKTRRGGAIILGLMYIPTLLHLGWLFARGGDDQVLSSMEKDNRLRELQKYLNTSNWIHLGINSDSPPAFTQNILASEWYENPYIESGKDSDRKTLGESLSNILTNGDEALSSQVRAELAALQNSLNPNGTATLDLFVRKTGIFGFKVIGILTADLPPTAKK